MTTSNQSNRTTGYSVPYVRAKLLINGAWVDSSDGGVSYVINPARGTIVGEAPVATAEDIDRAIEAARRAFKLWAATPSAERSKILKKAADFLEERAAAIAPVLTAEHGKPLKDARGELAWSASVLRFFAEEAVRISGEVLEGPTPSRRSLVIKQPIGVTAAIAPWNFPVDLLCWKLAPALAAGCTVVAKPASQTPLAAYLFMQCLVDAGVPEGVVNFVTGPGRAVGHALVSDPRISKVAFTGSTKVGMDIARAAAPNMTKVSLELGGHAPLIVLADADIDKAVREGVRRSFSHTGQICHSVNLILLEKPIANEFIDKFVAATRRLRVGDGLEMPDADMGPMTTEDGLRTVESHVADAVSKGAKVLLGGRRLSEPPYDKGLFYEPTVLTGITPDMIIAQEETFGPVAPIAIFEDLDEALEFANATRYGLVAYVYTRDLAKAFTVAEKLEAGSVGVNNCSVCQVNAPYGGWKQSGLGVELSHHGIEEYLRKKHIAIDLGN